MILQIQKRIFLWKYGKLENTRSTSTLVCLFNIKFLKPWSIDFVKYFFFLFIDRMSTNEYNLWNDNNFLCFHFDWINQRQKKNIYKNTYFIVLFIVGKKLLGFAAYISISCNSFESNQRGKKLHKICRQDKSKQNMRKIKRTVFEMGT